jgi:hypothetical protein
MPDIPDHQKGRRAVRAGPSSALLREKAAGLTYFQALSPPMATM